MDKDFLEQIKEWEKEGDGWIQLELF